MKHPTLKIEKTEAAYVTWGDYGADSPQGPGDWRWNHPAKYQVTGPTGRIYTVTGEPRSWMQYNARWYYEHGPIFDGAPVSKGGFRSKRDCLAAIAKLEATRVNESTGVAA